MVIKILLFCESFFSDFETRARGSLLLFSHKSITDVGQQSLDYIRHSSKTRRCWMACTLDREPWLGLMRALCTECLSSVHFCHNILMKSCYLFISVYNLISKSTNFHYVLRLSTAYWQGQVDVVRPFSPLFYSRKYLYINQYSCAPFNHTHYFHCACSWHFFPVCQSCHILLSIIFHFMQFHLGNLKTTVFLANSCSLEKKDRC